jgi:hypothetical protein
MSKRSGQSMSDKKKLVLAGLGVVGIGAAIYYATRPATASAGQLPSSGSGGGGSSGGGASSGGGGGTSTPSSGGGGGGGGGGGETPVNADGVTFVGTNQPGVFGNASNDTYAAGGLVGQSGYTGDAVE